MSLRLIKLIIVGMLAGVQAHPFSGAAKESPKAPFFILAGDSTTATQSSNGGGWGDGFLNTTLFRGANGINFGHNGATTVSFRAGGDWSSVLETVGQVRDQYNPFVTIQFGHNDQKATANISLSQYTKNLETFVTEVFNAGATPILVTPLSRRNYDNSTGSPLIIRSLANETAATISAAHHSGSKYIDLNQASTKYLNAIGPANAYTYNLNAADYTHLNVAGSVVFGGIVAEMIAQDFPYLKRDRYLRVNEQLKKDVERGIYYP
jgi:lysophospholipase L1-like esterase